MRAHLTHINGYKTPTPSQTLYETLYPLMWGRCYLPHQTSHIFMKRTLKLLSFTQRSIRAHPGLTLVATLCKCISLKCRCAIYLIISRGKSGRHNPLLLSFTGNNTCCRIVIARNGVLPPLTTKRRNRKSRKFLLFNYQKNNSWHFLVENKEIDFALSLSLP